MPLRTAERLAADLVAHPGRWLLYALVGLALSLSIASYLRPAVLVERHVAQPALQALGLLPSLCPAGWQDVSLRDEHQVVNQCTRGAWRVVLWPDGTFNYGFYAGEPPRFELDPTAVEGWPR